MIHVNLQKAGAARVALREYVQTGIVCKQIKLIQQTYPNMSSWDLYHAADLIQRASKITSLINKATIVGVCSLVTTRKQDFKVTFKLGCSIETASLCLNEIGFQTYNHLSPEEKLCAYIFNHTGMVAYNEMFQLKALEAIEIAVEAEFTHQGGSEAFCLLLNRW